jgi:hypothetical protein
LNRLRTSGRYMVPVDHNPKTRIAPVPADAKPSEAFFRVGFGLASQKIADLSAAEPGGVAVAAVTPRTGEVDAHYIRLDDASVETLVVGRHECADLVLRNDSALSLRHALVLLKKGNDGRPVIRVIDLRSTTGLRDMLGEAHAFIAANRPVALSASESAIFVLSSNPFLRGELLKNPFAVFDKIAWADSEHGIDRGAPGDHLSAAGARGETALVSVVPPESGRSDSSPAPWEGVIQFQTDNRSFEYKVDKIALKTGVLVGRCGRCDLSERAVAMPEDISRVHVLFLSMDEQIHVFDLGSTHGLLLDNLPVRGATLDRTRSSTFELVDNVRISWVPGA